MKNTNLSVIMKRAWEIKKENVENIFSICLKMAWKESKKPSVTSLIVWEKCEEVAELMKVKFGADYIKVSRNEFRKENIKEDVKTIISRDYYTIRAYRKGKMKREIPCGYFDNDLKQYVPMQNKRFEATNVFKYSV